MDKFYIGTESHFGSDSLNMNKNLIQNMGKKALVVTGKSSGYLSGAISDLEKIFKEYNIEYFIFDRVLNNPTLNNVKADFIVGVGGGSPLDAAKAIAVLATNDIEPLDLYKNEFTNQILPIIAIPTTAGTGSETTPFSILTRNDLNTKMSFGNRNLFPKYAFLDAKYTLTLSKENMINTAFDAISHSIESYLNRRSTVMSEIFAVEAFKVFGSIVRDFSHENFNYALNEKLLYVSMLGGMAISHTGTTFTHATGYSLTYFKGIPHGKANALLLGECLKFIHDIAQEKIDFMISKMNLRNLDDFCQLIKRMIKNDIVLTEEEMIMYSKHAMIQRSVKQTLKDVSENDLYEIIKKSFI